ncbi:MAG TPA: hypothetical protein VK601_18160 [Kofleriaceae bacterium]|nr:hypothetical protein [Kofleriaceae bacterium]
MADDDRAVMERLAALEAEVKADADAQRVRKAAAVAKLRDQRVTQTSGDEPVVRNRATADEPVARRRARLEARIAADADGEAEPADRLEDLGGALELASKANRVKQELQRAPRKGDKSWVVSGVASLALGPVGWLYAGSLREAVPATAAWLALALVASKILPVFLMMPILMVVLPLSGIAGVVYALSHNRAGRRQRMFDGKKAKAPAALSGSSAGARRKLRGGS